jgi:hypothetical protein
MVGSRDYKGVPRSKLDHSRDMEASTQFYSLVHTSNFVGDFVFLTDANE